jgi:enoyl-CoA hydratase/carnithine racemase
MTTVNSTTKPALIRLTKRSPAYWRVTIDNPPINVMGPEMVRHFQEVINALEADDQVRVVAFDSAVDDYFLNHSDFLAKLEHLTAMPAGPTGLPPWPDFLVRLTRVPVWYVNRALPDADLDAFVEALATRISRFDKWAIANTKRLVNTSLPPDVELGAGWDACIASLGRSAAQDGIKALMAGGVHTPVDVENRLGYYLSQIPR